MQAATPERLAIYPGSFDPVTNGHLDILDRALHLFDRVIFAIAPNVGKHPLFTPEERMDMALAASAHFGDRVTVEIFKCLTVDFAKQKGATAIVRGLRAVADFEFEFQLALANRRLAPELETIFLMPRGKYIFLSSSLMKEMARLGGMLSDLVPSNVEQALKDKFTQTP